MASPFKYFQTGFTVDQVPDLTGKVAIVTGGNTGLGFETVAQLAKKGARVFMAARSPDRAAAALEKLKTEIGSEAAARVEVLKLDLQDLKQVKAAAKEFLDKKLPLHMLVNNAGIMACPFGLTKDGIETQLGTNHVGHFAFTTELIPALEKETPSRVVNLSSEAHRWAPPGGILLDKVNEKEGMSEWERYGQSKLANILFTKSLDQKVGEKGIIVNAVHPGVVRTELMRGPNELYGPLVSMMLAPLGWFMGVDVKTGALTQIYAATSPEIEERKIRGQYLVPTAKLSKIQREEGKSQELADKLWDWTEKTVAEKLGA